ncbi:MAG: hypothetical protein ACM358_10210 [Gemmatimonadota bacterium]
MPKRPLKLHVRIPSYRSPRNEWRRLIHAAIVDAQRRSRARYDATDRLEVAVRFYMPQSIRTANDVDNRLRDVLDAVQGRSGGSKRARMLTPIVPNDRQIFRVIVEKQLPPKQSHGLGHLTIRRLGKDALRFN